MLTVQLSAFPVISSQRLVLRQLRPSDARQVFALRSDPLVMQYTTRALAVTEADALALITLINTTVAANDAVQWAITLKGGDAFIGLIGFWRMDKADHRAELGYQLQRAHWGKGLMSEAIATVVDFGFRTLGLHKVEAITRPANAASMRALEKNGFVREAYLKEDIFWNGTYDDSVYFGRLAK